MYYILSLLSGVLLAIMIALNGALAGEYGLHWATICIHVTGLALAVILVLAKRERPFAKRQPWFLYLGGAIGVLLTVFNNFAFGRISVSAILALVLLGQSITGLIMDHYGLWGMQKRRFSKGNLVGIILILCGIAPMLTDFEIIAVAMSFVSGIAVVFTRTINAKLADATTVRVGTLFNYVVGLSIALPIYFLFGGAEAGEAPLWSFVPTASHWYIYLGGVIGLATIVLSNITVLKISAFYLTLLVFIGQVATGIFIDALLDESFSARIFLGGVLVTAGLAANLLMDRKRQKEAPTN